MMEKYYGPENFPEQNFITEPDLDSEAKEITALFAKEEENNTEFRECKEKLEKEYERRVALAHRFIGRLEEEMGRKLDWFIAPPVMMRTDYGYLGDIDLLILDQGDIPENMDHHIDDIYIFPKFISQNDLAQAGDLYPEIKEWYEKKFQEEKQSGNESVGKFDLSEEFEDKLRYSIPEEKREMLRKFRKSLAQKFMEEAKRGVKILGWRLSGSTVKDKKFSVCSDLDLEFLVADELNPQEIFYTYNFLNYVYAENYGVKICHSEMTVRFIGLACRQEGDKLKQWEKYFNVDLSAIKENGEERS